MSDLLSASSSVVPPRLSRSGSETRKMQPRISFRVDEALLIKIEMDADAAGLSVGGYLRALAGGDRCTIRPHRRAPSWMVLLSQLKGEASRIGSNLNQLVKLANSGEPITRSELAQALQAVSTFYAHARRLLLEEQP
jgi:Bacterial mobilisation protein (MobC)